MEYQHVYQAKHLDFAATYEKIASVIPGSYRTWIGRKPQVDTGPISFAFPNTHIKVLIFPTHKIQVSWTDKDKEDYYEQLQKLLIPIKGYGQVQLKPLHATPKIPYPPPSSFRLSWCKKGFRYVQDKISGWPLIVAGFAFFLYLVLNSAFSDPSLENLNNTIINPLKAIPGIPIFLPIITLLCLVYYAAGWIGKKWGIC